MSHFVRTAAGTIAYAIPFAVGYYFARHMGWYFMEWPSGLVAVAIAHAIARPFLLRRRRRREQYGRRHA